MTDKKPHEHNEVVPHRIILQVSERVKSEDPKQIVKLMMSDKLGPWSRLIKDFPELKVRIRWRAKKSGEIKELIAKARELDPNYQPGPILKYLEVVCPNEYDVDKVLESLMAWATIRTAWVAPEPQAPPVVTPADDPRSPNQGYLDPAPDGIDAEFAWTIPGGDGANQGFVDIEWGWTLNHEDLTAHSITLLSGLNNGYEGHGTAVLGEVAAVDNKVGCVGITPELDSVSVIGQWRTATDFDIADAILDACDRMDFGEVLLLEAHSNYNGFSLVPVEAHNDTFEMIRLATALGIIVVEAGGNGGEDLDLVTNPAGDNFFDPSDTSFRDSGAIIVGAASSAAPHTRMGFSSHGARIDCYGWGQNVNSTGDGWTGTSTTVYTGTFSGTSSASPIIAGAALSVQGVAEAGFGLRFSPMQMREILTNPATSTASNDPAVDRIGVMPNLRAIIEDGEINLRPDVYIRDYIGDDGDAHSSSISASPDVILVPATVGDPNAAFGHGSGTENDNTLGHEATGGQDNYIYVRCLNRGGGDGTNTTARIFWSPPSTLVTPDLWTPVGNVILSNVEIGEILTVSDALTWPNTDIPAPGHYCFVAILDQAQDPGPTPVDFLDWDNFRSFVRENNNVTWRNFNVVPNSPPPGNKMIRQPFLMAGAFDEARKMRLEVTMRLPKGAKAQLRVPEHLAEYIQRIRSPFMKLERKKRTVLVPLNPHGRTRFCDVMMPAKVRYELELLISIPKETRNHSYLGWAAQLEEEQELGRVTWQFASDDVFEKRDAHLKRFMKRKR